MSKHVHIATVGVRPGPVTKAINAIGRIDVLYLLYTSDKEQMDQIHFIEDRELGEDENGTTNFISSSGTKNKTVKNKKSDTTKDTSEDEAYRKFTSEETALEIEKRLDIFIPYIHRVRIPLNKFWGIVHKITDIYRKERGNDVEFSINITGGTNLMVAAACYTSYYANADLYYMENKDANLDEQLLKVKRQTAINIDAMSDLTKRILKIINTSSMNNEQITATEIGLSMDLSRQKIKYHVDELNSLELIVKENYREGNRINANKKNLKITELGSIVATYV